MRKDLPSLRHVADTAARDLGNEAERIAQPFEIAPVALVGRVPVVIAASTARRIRSEASTDPPGDLEGVAAALFGSASPENVAELVRLVKAPL